MHRRRFLALLGGGTAAASAGVGANNLLLGYGRVTGTNIVEQPLDPIVNQRLGPETGRKLRIDGVDIEIGSEGIAVDETRLGWSAEASDITSIEHEYGLPPGTVRELLDDVPAVRREEHRLEAYTRAEFFDIVADAETHAATVTALRGPVFEGADSDLVERFTGESAQNPEAVVSGLVDGFREHTFYDAPRYAAGAIDDNALGGRGDLRDPFDSPADFEALLGGENDGVFCYDLSFRAIEALHAAPAFEQTVPVAAFHVGDLRHKHAYTGIATVLKGDDRPTLAVTFVDYTTTTAARDFGLRRLRGDDPNAYNEWHRATRAFWNRYIRM